MQGTDKALFTFPKDGFYTLILMMKGTKFTAEVQVEMLGKYGYLSAADWPLLPVSESWFNHGRMKENTGSVTVHFHSSFMVQCVWCMPFSVWHG